MNIVENGRSLALAEELLAVGNAPLFASQARLSPALHGVGDGRAIQPAVHAGAEIAARLDDLQQLRLIDILLASFCR